MGRMLAGLTPIVPDVLNALPLPLLRVALRDRTWLNYNFAGWMLRYGIGIADFLAHRFRKGDELRDDFGIGFGSKSLGADEQTCRHGCDGLFHYTTNHRFLCVGQRFYAAVNFIVSA